MKQFFQRLKIILQYNYIYYILLVINISYVFIYVNNYELKSEYNINDKNFVLTIKSAISKEDKITFEFNEKLAGTYYFKEKDNKNSFKYKIGDKLNITGSLNLPSNNTIFNTFNYKEYLNNKKIKYILTIDDITYLSSGKSIFVKFKNLINSRIENMKYNEYLYALIFGNSKHLESNTYNNYKVNGVLHLFSVSGLHVSLLVNIIIYILNKIRINKVFSFILTSFMLIIYSYLASFSPSILRATIFFILSSTNKLYYLNIKEKNILYITFMILTFNNPYYIYDIGFLLSFTITFFIFIFSEKVKIKGAIKSILLISFISFLASFPIVINMSYEINIIGFINNLFFIPYVSYIVFPLALLNLILPFLNTIFNFFILIMEKVSLVSSRFINITLYFSKLNILEIIIYYVLLFISLKNKKIKLLFIIFLIYLYIKPNFNNNEYLYIIDVNQGDSLLYVDKNNNSILIDSGGKNQFIKNTKKDEFNLMISNIIPFFKSIGIKKIDYFIVTHGDYDHMGEAINLVNNFKVENVIFNCGKFNNLEKELISVLDKKKIKYYSCIKELNIGNNKLYILNNNDYGNENDNSIVLYTEINTHKFLFMGDASVKTEKDIMDKYNLKDIDVIKVGHHGSKTSSGKEFIDKVNPKYSIISVGKNNRYHHPNTEVIDNLKESKIYRTDIDGSILFKINKDKLNISTCPP